MHLDAVLLSHADADHFNALPELLERFSVGKVYVPPGMLERETPALTALREAMSRRRVRVGETWAGDRLSGGLGCRIEVLHPPRRGVLGSDNANSMVLAIEHQGRRILLTGDIERPGLDDLRHEEPWPCDVLLAPHHGSRGADPPGLSHWCSPKIVVISGGSAFDVRQTTNTYRAIGARVLHTAEDGAVHVRIDDDDLRITSVLTPR
jgi:competence protein ComEC